MSQRFYTRFELMVFYHAISDSGSAGIGSNHGGAVAPPAYAAHFSEGRECVNCGKYNVNDF